MSRVPGLDLLRAIAISWVMYYHALTFDLVPENLISRFGWMSVDLFFVLSGFLIGGQLMAPLGRGEPLGFGRFWMRRALRIFPAYFAVVALYFAFPHLQEWGAIQPLWQFLTFTENLFIQVPPAKSFSHVWSLCVEEHFYLTAPVLVWLLVRQKSLGLTLAVLAAVVLGGMALRAALWLSLPPAGRGFDTQYMERIYYPSWTRLDGLAVGMALAATKTLQPEFWARLVARSNLMALIGLAGVGISTALFWDEHDFVPAIVGYPALAASMGLLVTAASGTRGVLGRWRIPGIGWLAAISYSLYLIHKIAFRAVDNAWGHWLSAHPLAAIAAYAGAALAAGSLLHYGIERPFLRLRERLTARPVRAPTPVAEAA
jgi:peptidoglycan/LPS O-acetylase OafA/YrhL